MLLERVHVHAPAVLRHRLDDHGADELKQPLLAIILVPFAGAGAASTTTQPTAVQALLLPPLALGFPLLLLALRLRCGGGLQEGALLLGLLRGGGSGDDGGRLGLRALETRDVCLGHHLGVTLDHLVVQRGAAPVVWAAVVVGAAVLVARARGREPDRLDGGL